MRHIHLKFKKPTNCRNLKIAFLYAHIQTLKESIVIIWLKKNVVYEKNYYTYLSIFQNTNLYINLYTRQLLLQMNTYILKIGQLFSRLCRNDVWENLY